MEEEPYYPTITGLGSVAYLNDVKSRRRSRPIGFAPPKPKAKPMTRRKKK